LVAGDTTILVAFDPPGLQVYEEAPDAVNVVDVPTQRVVVEGLMTTVGIVLTTREIVFVAVHPKPSAPVTE
jgi:hypothetical protein